MNHGTLTYYQDHEEYDELQVDDDEEYQEDRYLQHHQGRAKLGGLGLVHDDDDSEDDEMYNSRRHRGLPNTYGEMDDSDEDVIEIEDDYDEVDMDQHNIQLLSGSLSVRSPFLDAIREEEEEDAVFAKPSSYPTLGTGKHFHRLSSGDNFSGWASKRSSLEIALADKQLLQKQQQQESHVDDQQQTNFNNTNQSDSSKPRGPRPPLLLGRPRSNSTSLTRVTTGFDPTPPAATNEKRDNLDDKKALRETQVSPENSIQDLEVKRVLEGAALVSASPSGDPEEGTFADTTPLPSANIDISAKAVSLAGSSGGGIGRASTSPSVGGTVSFGQDTQKSIDEFFGMVKSDLDKRIQEAIQEVEKKFLHRVQKLEEHTATLSGAPSDVSSGSPKSGSLMESLTRPLPADQNPGGSLALRKEILSHVTEKVGDLDLRVNQMEVLVSYKLVDIESKVRFMESMMNSIATVTVSRPLLLTPLHLL